MLSVVAETPHTTFTPSYGVKFVRSELLFPEVLNIVVLIVYSRQLTKRLLQEEGLFHRSQ